VPTSYTGSLALIPSLAQRRQRPKTAVPITQAGVSREYLWKIISYFWASKQCVLPCLLFNKQYFEYFYLKYCGNFSSTSVKLVSHQLKIPKYISFEKKFYFGAVPMPPIKNHRAQSPNELWAYVEQHKNHPCPKVRFACG